MDLLDEALERIYRLLDTVKSSDLREPMAMALATAGSDGQPTVRHVLLKKVDRDGFVFYTNTTSRKGQQLAENSRAALCFYWQGPHEQVQAEGVVEPVPDVEADAYWITRDRASQIGAWASMQSQELDSREELMARVKRYEKKFEGQDVPRPEFWSGYRLVPALVEFWKGHPERLNERLRYQLVDGEWSRFNVYP